MDEEAMLIIFFLSFFPLLPNKETDAANPLRHSRVFLNILAA